MKLEVVHEKCGALQIVGPAAGLQRLFTNWMGTLFLRQFAVNLKNLIICLVLATLSISLFLWDLIEVFEDFIQKLFCKNVMVQKINSLILI